MIPSAHKPLACEGEKGRSVYGLHIGPHHPSKLRQKGGTIYHYRYCQLTVQLSGDGAGTQAPTRYMRGSPFSCSANLSSSGWALPTMQPFTPGTWNSSMSFPESPLTWGDMSGDDGKGF